MVVVIIRQTQE